MAKRLEYFDIAKGIGIICVLIGHTAGVTPVLWTIINSFHMPLFFIISGYFFKQISQKELLRRNAQRLLLPYFFTCMLFIIYFSVQDLRGGVKKD